MPTYVKIDTRAFFKAINPDRTILPIIEEKFYKSFAASKQALFNDLESDPITQELALGGGNSALEADISNVLNGYGTLFTFIGFERNTNPVKDLLKFLDSKIKLMPTVIKTPVTKGVMIRYSFIIQMPKVADFVSELPLPWTAGKSWVFAIENGISNFGYYMFLRRNAAQNSPAEASRSGFGLQMKKAVNLTTFTKRKYISKHLENFNENLQKTIGYALLNKRYGIREFNTGRFVKA